MKSLIRRLISQEETRMASCINMIASENYTSPLVRNALSSHLSQRYAEGYPRNRYYGGLGVVDEIELATQQLALRFFGLDPSKWDCNVQALSGSIANLAIYSALVPLGNVIASLSLTGGGHLTHGSSVSISSKLWKFKHYHLCKENDEINYPSLISLFNNNNHEGEMKAVVDMVVAGASAYPREIEYKRIKDSFAVETKLMCDISHTSGLLRSGEMKEDPFAVADVVMTTTHKSLRGPRGALIFSKKAQTPMINRAVFPYIQGGPHVHSIAAIGLALEEGLTDSYAKYQRQTLENASTLAAELGKSFKGTSFSLLTGGTSTNQVMIVLPLGTAKTEAKIYEAVLEKNGGIISNMNVLSRGRFGIRLGTSYITSVMESKSSLEHHSVMVDLSSRISSTLLAHEKVAIQIINK